MNKTYNTICEQLVAAIQASGTLPWHQPWYGTTQAVRYATGKPYSILNQLLLGGIADEFLTWNQVQQHQARLRKGCHGHRVYFWHCFEKVELDQPASETEQNQQKHLRSFQCTIVKESNRVGNNTKKVPPPFHLSSKQKIWLINT